LTERELRRFGIGSYGTPSDPAKGEHPFYGWMLVSFRVFEIAAACGFRRFASGRPAGTAMEVFPHASAVVLAGALPPRGSPKHAFRRDVLRARGVEVDALGSADQVDAALAALTGLFALHGECFAPGDPVEGVIVLPARTLPPPPYRRAVAAPTPERQPHLPGLSPCACGAPGCAALTASEFAPGHDAKRKSLLWRTARRGDAAEDELRRRGWELPPELR
jgi:predicted RNase H-like nuclease